MTADIVLILVLAGGFVLGFFRGVVRQALTLGAWVLVFVAAAYLRAPVGDWLASTRAQFSPDYAYMLAHLAIFFGLFGGALVLLQFGGAGSKLTRHPILDDALGGVLALLNAALAIAALIVILDSFFARPASPTAGELAWLADLQRALEGSTVAGIVGDLVVRPLGLILGPLLPSDVRAVMG